MRFLLCLLPVRSSDSSVKLWALRTSAVPVTFSGDLLLCILIKSLQSLNLLHSSLDIKPAWRRLASTGRERESHMIYYEYIVIGNGISCNSLVQIRCVNAYTCWGGGVIIRSPLLESKIIEPIILIEAWKKRLGDQGLETSDTVGRRFLCKLASS